MIARLGLVKLIALVVMACAPTSSTLRLESPMTWPANRPAPRWYYETGLAVTAARAYDAALRNAGPGLRPGRLSRQGLTSGSAAPIVGGVTTPIGLRELRRTIGTQEQVGSLLGLTRRTVGVYERQPDRAPAWYRLALEQLAAKQRPALVTPASPQT